MQYLLTALARTCGRITDNRTFFVAFFCKALQPDILILL